MSVRDPAGSVKAGYDLLAATKRETKMKAFCCSGTLVAAVSVTFLALLCPDSASAESDVATLREGGPTIIHLPKAPKDLGHLLSIEALKPQSRLASGKERDSAPEGASGHVLLSHPMRKGITNPNVGFYAISNYVDQDMAAPDMLLDYECGERTYDLDDGTNHNGVDYFNWPFAWMAMDQDATIVVAAADGVIIEKIDGEPDMNCEFTEEVSPSNQIALEHDDGTITLYAHLKESSTTALGVGDRVEKGDYLGVVGSSGFSTGPHLHLGVYDSSGGLIEPHAGACNSLNDDSWWEDQEDYFVPGMNHIATHSEVPVFPPCPEIEQPYYQNNFSPGDAAFFSVFFRDLLADETTTLEIRDADGLQLLQWTYDYPDGDHEAAIMVVWEVMLAQAAPSGSYMFRVNYAGVTREHTFYINSGPPPPPTAPTANNAANGLYFDTGLDGEGYNFVTADAGTIVYFYGSDMFGNRLWLISDLIQGAFGPGTVTEVTMYESTGGTFGSPVPSARGLSVWGTLIIQWSDCDNAVATLSGVDGNKVSQLIKLAGVAGTGCGAGAATPDSPWSGLWYALADEGEGYNFIVAPNGAILYYYGFKTNGKRLWLISDLIQLTLQPGVPVEIAVFEATQGTFNSPAPSSQLSQWGTATITLEDCNDVTITLIGNDGSKTSQTVRLAGVVGLSCSD